MKIVRTDRELQIPKVESALREAGHALEILPDGVCEDDLVAATRDADLILMCYTPIPARVINEARNLKGIVKFGVGIDAIDIPAAIERGIPVVNIPEYAEETVAEGAFALMIALAKKLQPLSRHMQETGWAWPEPQWLGSDIAGKTLGLVGFGKIGRNLARMAGAGFRARVLAYNPSKSAEEIAAGGAEKCDDLRGMLAQSDFVSIHCVLNEQTKGLIGADEIAAMKPSACLINTSRGAIVDEIALLAALKEGRVAGAALDVFSHEPLTRTGHPLSELFDMPNVILSPHLAFYTEDAVMRLETETLERCFEVLEGRQVLVKSIDPRLRAQREGIVFGG